MGWRDFPVQLSDGVMRGECDVRGGGGRAEVLGCTEGPKQAGRMCSESGQGHCGGNKTEMKWREANDSMVISLLPVRNESV